MVKALILVFNTKAIFYVGDNKVLEGKDIHHLLGYFDECTILKLSERYNFNSSGLKLYYVDLSTEEEINNWLKANEKHHLNVFIDIKLQGVSKNLLYKHSNLLDTNSRYTGITNTNIGDYVYTKIYDVEGTVTSITGKGVELRTPKGNKFVKWSNVNSIYIIT